MKDAVTIEKYIYVVATECDIIVVSKIEKYES